MIAIVGPTASGKSELAMMLAREYQGEVICADSRTIYRGMNIGTAKPSTAEQAEVPHHLLDIVQPDQNFSAAEFKASALQQIADINSRGHLPILVGGSGLYIYSVLYDYDFPAGASNELRQQLQQKTLKQLVEQLQQLDPEAAVGVDLKNARRVIRAIETAGQAKQHSRLGPDTTLVGLRPDQEVLEARINARTQGMLEAGLVSETKQLVTDFGPDLEVLRSPGYAESLQYLTGSISSRDLEGLINLHTRQLAKRQLTWFKRNLDIVWFQDSAAAYDYVVGRIKAKQV